MKKKLLLILCVALLFCVTGCGVSKEEVFNNSKELNLEVLAKDISNNELNAADKYENNYYIIKGKVSSIKKGYITISATNLTFRVPLENDDLKKISNSQLIEIAGKLLDIKNNENEIEIEMDKSYLKSDSFLISGKVNIPKRRHLVNFVDYTGVQKSRTYYDDYDDDEWFLEIGDYKVTSAEKQNFKGEGDTVILGKKIEDGMQISVMGKVFSGKEIKDIVKIEIDE